MLKCKKCKKRNCDWGMDNSIIYFAIPPKKTFAVCEKCTKEGYIPEGYK